MDFNRVISITILVFTLLTLYFNFVGKDFYLPGDIYIDKLGFKLHIPILSTIVLSVIITFLLSLISK